MVNLAVINIKDIIRYIFKFIVCIIVIFFVYKLLFSLKTGGSSISLNENIFGYKLENKTLLNILNSSILSLNNTKVVEDEIHEEIASIKLPEIVFKSQFKVLYNIEDIEGIEGISDNTNVDTNDNVNTVSNNSNSNSNSNDIETANIEFAKTGLKTEVIKNNVANNYTTTYNSVQIKNGTTYKLTKEILAPDIDIKNKNIIIFHTHTCESYTPTDKYNYESTGTYRTTDSNYNVVRVGNELERQLESYGYNVIHDKTYHDYPSYTGSYERSLSTVKNILSKNNYNSDIIIDIHRDAIGDYSYAPTVKIGDEYASQLMFVIGSDGGGLEHPNWKNNLKFAVKVQEKANELYPGLFKPIILRNSRYNQHLGSFACIIEVGATGNTLEQSIVSMKYLAKVISEVLK